MYIQDREYEEGAIATLGFQWFTYGHGYGRFGGAHKAPGGKGTAHLHEFKDGELVLITIKCRSHREAVRRLRRWIGGHNQ